MKMILNKYANRFIIFFVSLFFIGEFLTKSSIVFFDGSFNRINGLFKITFEFLMVIYIIVNFKLKKVLYFIIVLSSVFFLSQLNQLSEIQNTYLYLAKGNLYQFNLFIYIFLFIFFVNTAKIKNETYFTLIKIFKVVLYFNIFLMVIGAIFNIEFFKTYIGQYRFGYNGFFARNGDVSYLHMILLVLLYYENVVLKHKNIMVILITTLASLLIGKKVIILFLILLFLTHLVLHYKELKKYWALIVLPTLTFIFFSDKIFVFLINYFPFWKKIYIDYGLIGLLTSTRSILFEKSMLYISHNWSVLNLFIGGVDYNRYKVEFEFVDVFLFFGITGVITYVLFLKHYFFDKNDRIKNYLLSIILISSFVSGGLFLSVICMLFLYIIFSHISLEKS